MKGSMMVMTLTFSSCTPSLWPGCPHHNLNCKLPRNPTPSILLIILVILILLLLLVLRSVIARNIHMCSTHPSTSISSAQSSVSVEKLVDHPRPVLLCHLPLPATQPFMFTITITMPITIGGPSPTSLVLPSSTSSNTTFHVHNYNFNANYNRRTIPN